MPATSLAIRAFSATVDTYPEPLRDHAAAAVRTARAGNPDLAGWIERRAARIFIEGIERNAFGEALRDEARRLASALYNLASSIRLEERVRHGRREPYAHSVRARSLAIETEIDPSAWYVRRPLDARFALSAAARLAA